MEICALCGREKNLLKSHFIPRFVSNWIKKTSATGYLRQAININKRIQDGIKEEFLCKDCEIKFSKYENYFANQIFYPYLNKSQISFEYDENLKQFLISISWRLLKRDLDEFKKFQPHMFKHAKEAEKYWRMILLNDKRDERYEHHLFLWDYIKSSTVNIPDKFQYYMMRSIDGTIAFSKGELFLFVKFPSMFFISSIYPNSINAYWDNTLIKENGNLCTKHQSSEHPGFWDFLLSRVDLLTQAKLSSKQCRKIERTMLADLDKVANSKSFELWYQELKRKKL